jgi:crotonobetainyl-CoA:carnitine CoA-transferase CaiB-like acyl-CoA transferase
MAGVWDGVEVLDLSWGISGPMAGMLLADNGARVTRIEPPSGDPFSSAVGTSSGYRVWNRGKRSAVLDLKDAADRERFLALAAKADVVIESYSPGTAKKLGVDYDALAAVNPRLVYCSITGYGLEGKHADRPAFDALVAARTGQHWESRGVVGGTIARLSGAEGIMPGIEAPEGCWEGAQREGPLFGGVPWPSMATFYLATLGIAAALRAREVTGRGQHVHTSLLQGALVTTAGPWQRVEHPDAPHYQSWIIDPRAPKNVHKCSDGRYVHQWSISPPFVLGVSEGDHIEVGADIKAPKDAPMRIALDPEEMILLHYYFGEMAERFAKFPSTDWEAAAAKVGVPLQIVRSPEEALRDQLLVDDGCVVEVPDTENGPIREVGRVIRLDKNEPTIGAGAPAPGQHTAEVRAEADAAKAAAGAATGSSGGGSLGSPLEGITVIDLGLAVAGPFGTQMLSDLGATVIKVNTLTDGYWMSNHVGMCCNRGKQSIQVNLKDAQGMEILHELVRQADVVQHNMRYDAAERLGVDYESLKKINPSLVYCHTRGHEKGPRALLPGNDQTGACLGGTEWMDGGTDNGGKPIWPTTSLGDTGNGLLSAIGIVQALYHRDRTGEGQFLDTSILYAHLLNCSTAWTSADGTTVGDRQKLDAMQLGWSALYRLYETSDGWLCIAVFSDDHWAALCRALGAEALLSDARFASAADRRANDSALADELQQAFGAKSASDWFEVLDAAGVPCEVSTPDFIMSFFDDPEMIEKGWVATYQHPVVGRMNQFGLTIDFSETPGKVQGPPLTPGQHTRQILTGIGYDDEKIEKLIAQGVIKEYSPAGN